MARILVAGETIVDFLPDSTGSLSAVESFARRPGGAPANVAVGLARLDADLEFWTRIGGDPFGDFLAGALSERGVSTAYVERDSDAKTTLAFVSLGEDADREFCFYRDRAAETRMEPGTIPDDDLAAFDWVHFDVLSLDAEPSRSAALDLAKRAREAGATVSFDPNARPERWREFSYAESAREGFALADVVKATPEDLREAGFDGDAPKLARAVCERGPHTALVTLGGEGSYAYATADAPWATETTEATHGGYDVDSVDTTGAGDAFTAGVVAGLAGGETLADALAFGNAVAALTTTAAGAMTALPTREEVADFVESADLDEDVGSRE
ncbi:carbohydrate kinase family protein [Halegenticoccus tardaugens]|uniref:carbohydrate kinase family protein n=1 Tax=Halegenticoccus tardaugens TaxID=2071624 RepID=UPI00100A8090|nr:carbohydrate kinase [Halegenticoccus tardaugens]